MEILKHIASSSYLSLSTSVNVLNNIWPVYIFKKNKKPAAEVSDIGFKPKYLMAFLLVLLLSSFEYLYLQYVIII